MGFAEGFNAAIAYGNLQLKRQQVRSEVAKTNAELIERGFDPTSGQPTDAKRQIIQQNQELMLQQLEQQKMLLKAQRNKIIKTESAQQFSLAANTGNWNILNSYFKDNPDVADMFRNTLGITRFSNVNFDDPNHQAILKKYLDTTKLDTNVGDVNKDGKVDKQDMLLKIQQDEDYRKLFQKTHFIAYDEKGNPKLMDTHATVGMLGLWKNMAGTDFNAITETYDKFTQATKGVLGLTQAQIKTEGLKQEKYKTETEYIPKKFELEKQKKAVEIEKLKSDIANNRLEAMNKKLDILKKQYNIEDEQAVDTVRGNITDLATTVVTNPDKVDTKTLAILKTYSDKEGYKQIDANTKRTLQSADRFITSGNKLLTMIKDDKNFDMNAYQTLKSQVMKYIGEHPEATKEEIADKISELKKHWKVETGMGMLLSQYLLDTSGMAVTDDEYKRKLNIIFGGNLTDKSAIVAKLEQAIDDNKNTLDSTLTKVAKVDPYTAWVYKSKLGESSQVTKPKQEPKKKPDLSQFWK